MHLEHFSTGVYTIWAHHEERSSVRVEVEVVDGGEGPRVDLQLVGSHCHSYVYNVLVSSMKH